MKKEKNVMTPKRKEIIKNISITISKESKKVKGRNIKLIETLNKILDKAKRQAYLLLLIQQLLQSKQINQIVTDVIKLITMNLKELVNFIIMNKTTSSIISFLLIGLVVFVGRRLGLGLVERVIAVILVLGLFELIKNKLKK